MTGRPDPSPDRAALYLGAFAAVVLVLLVLFIRLRGIPTS